MIGLDAIGTSLVELGFATDAVPVFREALALSGGIDKVLLSLLMPNFTDSARTIGEHLNAAIDGLNTSSLARVAGRSIAEAASEPANATTGGAGQKPIHARGGPVLDLMTIVHPQNLDRATMRGLFADSIAQCDPGERAQLKKPLESLRDAHPDDLSVAIAIAFDALASSDSNRAEASLDQLAKLVAEDLARPAGRGRAAQRTRACPGGQPDTAVADRPRLPRPPEPGRSRPRRPLHRPRPRSRPPPRRSPLAARVDARARTDRIRPERSSFRFRRPGLTCSTFIVTPPQAKSRRPPPAAPGAGAPGRRPFSASASQRAPAPEE